MQTVIVALVFVEWAGIDKICLPETHFLPPQANSLQNVHKVMALHFIFVALIIQPLTAPTCSPPPSPPPCQAKYFVCTAGGPTHKLLRVRVAFPKV